MTDPWRDPDRYKKGKLVQCLGCEKTCHRTNWGNWCYECNVKRIDRINKGLEEALLNHAKQVKLYREGL